MSYIPLFLTGYLISRLSVRYGLVEAFFTRVFGARREAFSRFLFFLLLAATIVSMFIPNFIAALTLLPILETIREEFEQRHDVRTARRLTTSMVVIVIYGCNIGGMGSLVGSPANALMLGALEIFKVAGREKINFLSWFGWSLPLVAILVLIAWAQVAFILVPAKMRALSLQIPVHKLTRRESKLAPKAWMAMIVWFAFWILHSMGDILFPVEGASLRLPGMELSWDLWDLIAVIFGALYLAGLFFPAIEIAAGRREALLRWQDCFDRFPMRGFIFVALALGVSGLFILLGLPKWLALHLEHMLPSNPSPWLLYFVLCFFTTMATEFFSNTSVSVVLFPVVHALATSFGINPLVALMAVGLASTNAFMTPIGTPVNALLFGGVKNVSLPIMLASGLLLNIISAIWMSAFLEYVIPWYYGLQ